MQITARSPLACLALNISVEYQLAGHTTSHLRIHTRYKCSSIAILVDSSYALARLRSTMFVAIAAPLVVLSFLIPRCAAQDPPGYPDDSSVGTSGTTRLVSVVRSLTALIQSADRNAARSQRRILSRIQHVLQHRQHVHAQADTCVSRSQTAIGSVS